MSSMDELRAQCLACQNCQLSERRTNVVFGCGDPSADVMFVGEGPGREEDEQGIPFVGAAGRLLDDMLLAVGISREKVYIANIVKCRPPQNRDPLPEERQACIGWLRAQTKLIRPRIIVCLGRIAAGVIIHDDYHISREHGTWTERAGVRMTATFHPAALLRNAEYRAPTIEDLILIRQEAEALGARIQ